MSTASEHGSSPIGQEADVGKWQPIETAPRDGTWVLLYWPMTRTNVIVSGHFYHAKDLEEFWWSLPRVDSDKEPTHWMPLPSPPTTSTAGR